MVRPITISNVFPGVSGLSCYRCGQLSSNARSIEDCSGVITIEQCDDEEACVIFKRLYVKGSGLKSCLTTNLTLNPANRLVYIETRYSIA
jgi:hypothetical protein